MLKTPLKYIITIALTLGLTLSFNSLLASWKAPTDIPPNDNVRPPINEGYDEQTKLGLLNLADGLTVSSSTILDGSLLMVTGKAYMTDETIDSDPPNTLVTKSYLADNAGGVPMGTVSAFNLVACPTGWTLANGLNGTPDLRGVFIRGLDLGRGIDIGRSLGTFQDDEFESHDHFGGSTVLSWPKNEASSFGPDYDPSDPDGVIVTESSTGGSETRPKNVALVYCMKVATNPPEEVGVLSVSPTRVFLTDNTKHFSVGGDIYMNGNKKVATEEYVINNSGGGITGVSSTCINQIKWLDGGDWIICPPNYVMTGAKRNDSDSHEWQEFRCCLLQ